MPSLIWHYLGVACLKDLTTFSSARAEAASNVLQLRASVAW